MSDELRLDLDALNEEPYFGTQYDIEGEGHAITIKKENKNAFLDEYSKTFRDKVEELLEEVEEDDDDD